MASMYELTADYMAVLEMANDPEVDPVAIADTLDGIGGEIEIKAENTAIILLELTAEVEKIKAEETRLAERRKRVDANITAIKNRLYEAMKLTKKEKFKTALFNFSIGKNPAKLIIDDESKIPGEYFLPQPPKLDAATLKRDLKCGVICDYAHLEQGESLRIK